MAEDFLKRQIGRVQLFRQRLKFATIMNRNSQRGVALVITLLMLAIITLITVVFLATAKRDSSATNQALALTDAEQSAEAALRRAIADMVSQVMARGDLTG